MMKNGEFIVSGDLPSSEVLLSPRQVTDDQELLNSSVYGASVFIAGRLILGGVRSVSRPWGHPVLGLDEGFYNTLVLEWMEEVDDDDPEEETRPTFPRINNQHTDLARYILDINDYELPRCLTLIGDAVANINGFLPTEHFRNHKIEDRYNEQVEGLIPRDEVVMDLISLGLGDKITDIFDRFTDDEISECAPGQDKNGVLPAVPFVALLLNEEEMRKILPEDTANMFEDIYDMEGYAVMRGDVLYIFNDVIFSPDEPLCHVAALLIIPEAVEMIRKINQ